MSKKDDHLNTSVMIKQQNMVGMPGHEELANRLAIASSMIDDIVLKKYLCQLSDYEIVPLEDGMKNISAIRMFKITEMVYQKDEYSTYKLASVFGAVQNLNCGIFIIMNGNGAKTDFYMGVRSFDDKRTTKSLKDTLKHALEGQFPGVKTKDMMDKEASALLADIATKNIATVSCVARNKDENFTDNETFIQGLEKFAIAMQGQQYTAVVLAKSTPSEVLDEARKGYETIYTQLSPYANMQLSYGTNSAITVSDALSRGVTTGSSYSVQHSTQKGTSDTHTTGTNESTTKQNFWGTLAKTVGTAALGIASIATAPLTGGASIAAAATIAVGNTALGAYTPSSKTKGTSTSDAHTVSESTTEGTSETTNQSESTNDTHTEGTTTGQSNNMQLTMQNKSLIDTMEKIDLQLKRLDECESIGMWECATYFISDSQETTEMAAGTYKALMKGEKSGLETSSINYWGKADREKLPVLREYITNFVHPVFMYDSQVQIPVTAASLVSSNELAIQMGLPRKSVCGFPVIEHADFGKEVVKYSSDGKRKREFEIGNIFSMGKNMDVPVSLGSDSLTMHTFITGSTGSGKSNTIYEILNQLRLLYQVPFLVVEPAKGEYKNVFGQFGDVSVYGTNPKKMPLLKINPFSFPQDIHILEHLDRLVEIFNVCWPMYAAMPAILKDAIERAYISVGWDLATSENRNGDQYPNFADVLEQIDTVIGESSYSSDSKGDYSGALSTRVRSLTTGLNGLIFNSEEINNADLFDKNVIVDLSRVGSVETKSLIMGLLIMKLNEYRMSSGKSNSPLSHITVLEEAHNLLKRTSTEQSAEGSNLTGKSVELLANSIAEMRTYGEGFVIADQAPGLLDMSVIRNTNTKIILRLPEKSDRELVGFAAGLNDEQIDEISKLKKGVAVVYQNDWIEPLLVQINKCSIQEREYGSEHTEQVEDLNEAKSELLKLLVLGRINESFAIDTGMIRKSLTKMKFSTDMERKIEDLLAEYEDDGDLSIWSDQNFKLLSKFVTDIARTRRRVENCVLTVKDNNELTDELKKLVLDLIPNASQGIILAIAQCFMKDMSVQDEERERREEFYMNWFESIRERSRRNEQL